MGADGFENLADAIERQSLDHEAMKLDIQGVKPIHVALIDRRALIGKIPADPVNPIAVETTRATLGNLHLEHSTHQHPLLYIPHSDARNIRSALRLDHHETVEG